MYPVVHERCTASRGAELGVQATLAWVKPQTLGVREGKLVACASFSHRLWLMLDPPYPGSRPKLTPPETLRSTFFTRGVYINASM